MVRSLIIAVLGGAAVFLIAMARAELFSLGSRIGVAVGTAILVFVYLVVLDRWEKRRPVRLPDEAED